jgi:hypothetical protein
MNADERRFIARAYIAFVRMFLLAAQCKNQGASLQSARSPQRDGGARGEGRWGGAGWHVSGATAQDSSKMMRLF